MKKNGNQIFKSEAQNWTKLSKEQLKRLSASCACMYGRKSKHGTK